MKDDLFKYIFIIVIVLLTGFAVYQVYGAKFHKEEGKETKPAAVPKELIYELHLGIAEFDTLDPIKSKNRQVQEISKLIYEPLIDLTEDYKIKNCLATECSKVEKTKYLLKLRENVIWHNGAQFSAQDVVDAIERIKVSDSIYLSMVEKIEQVQILDENTIKISLIEEVPFFAYYLTFPIYKEENCGTGKYQLISENEKEMLLEENKSWWGRKEEFVLKSIHIEKFVSLNELYSAFKAERIDLVSTANLGIRQYIRSIRIL